MLSNKKKWPSTLPPLPSKETVQQELKIIAGALFTGSRFSGSESDAKSFMIKTPALAAVHDEGRFTQIINISPEGFMVPRFSGQWQWARSLNLSRSGASSKLPGVPPLGKINRVQDKSDPRLVRVLCRILTTGPCQACLVVI